MIHSLSSDQKKKHRWVGETPPTCDAICFGVDLGRFLLVFDIVQVFMVDLSTKDKSIFVNQQLDWNVSAGGFTKNVPDIEINSFRRVSSLDLIGTYQLSRGIVSTENKTTVPDVHFRFQDVFENHDELSIFTLAVTSLVKVLNSQNGGVRTITRWVKTKELVTVFHYDILIGLTDSPTEPPGAH